MLLFSTIPFSSPLSLSKPTSSCLDVSLLYKCCRFFPLSHTNRDLLFQFCFKGLSLSKACGWCRGKTLESWVQSPVVKSYWLVRAPAWRVVGSKGACYTLPVKVEGDNEEEAHACLYFPRTTVAQEVTRTVLQGNCAFQNCEEKIKKKRPIRNVFEELFVSPSGTEQRVVGGGGMVRGRRGRHPLETVRFVACVEAQSARD